MVGGRDDHGNQGGIEAPAAIGDGVGELFQAVEAGLRRVGDMGRVIDHAAAVIRRAYEDDAQRAAAGAAVIRQHIQKAGRAVYIQGEEVIVRHGRFDLGRYRDGDGGDVEAAAAVGDVINQALHTAEIDGRGIGEHTAVIDYGAALIRRANGDDGQGIVVWIAVVGQHIQRVVGAVFEHGKGVVIGGWVANAGCQFNLHQGRGLGVVAVRDGIGEGFCAGKIGSREVGQQAAIAGQHAALVRRPHGNDGQRVAVHIQVVGQHIQQVAGAVFGQGEMIGDGQRIIVARGHVDGDQGVVEAAVAI